MTAANGETPILRPTARVLLLDPDDRLLLFRAAQPDRETGRPFWFPAGGGVEPGETYEACAIRELFEETGIVDCTLGPCVWTRDVVAPFGGMLYRFEERYFVVRLAKAYEISVANHTAEELVMLAEHRWWSASAIASSPDIFVPRALAELLPAVLRGLVSAEPLHVTR